MLVEEGDTVAVGTPVAVLTATADEPFDLDAVPGASASAAVDPGSTGSAATDGEDAPRSDAAVERPRTPRRPPSRPRTRAAAPGNATLTPVVRRLLDEHGLDPADVIGSGRDGRITRADVLAAAANPPMAPAPASATNARSAIAPPESIIEPGPDDEVVPYSKARAATAEHMRRSLDTAAHALVAVPVDYAKVDPVRRAAKLSFLPFVARAVVDAIRDFPHVNASVDADRLIVHRAVHLGVAVDVDQEALMVPVLKGAHELRLRALSDGISDLADKARRRRLPGDAFGGGTFTITNVGSYGTVITAPIISRPQVAILSSDGVRMTPVAVPIDPEASPGGADGWAVAVHPVGNLSLSFDHRAIDGAYAAAFLARVRSIVEERDWSAEVAR